MASGSVSYRVYPPWRSPRLFREASTRLQALSFWGVLIFVLEALLFILVGQELPAVIGNIEKYSFTQVLLYAALVYGVVLGARFVWFFTTPYLHPVFDRLLRHRYLRAPWQERLVMSWSGMRGGVSLAAALTVPLTVEGVGPFPRRELILFLTFSVILATLMELKARLRGAHAALGRLEQLCDGDRVPPDAQERMREFYEDRIRRYTAGLKAGGPTDEYAESSVAWRGWRRELLAAEREAIISLRDEGKISPEVMRRIEYDIDLEESRIGG